MPCGPQDDALAGGFKMLQRDKNAKWPGTALTRIHGGVRQRQWVKFEFYGLLKYSDIDAEI